MEEKEQRSLFEWMEELGFTQRSLAHAAGISHTIISFILDGTRTSIRPDTRAKIARALGLEMRQIKEFGKMIDERLGKDYRQPEMDSQLAA